jgi:hypothetical protein
LRPGPSAASKLYIRCAGIISSRLVQFNECNTIRDKVQMKEPRRRSLVSKHRRARASKKNIELERVPSKRI